MTNSLSREGKQRNALQHNAQQKGAHLVAQQSHVVTVEDLAARWQLKPQTANGETEYHGAHPMGAGATKDGFWLNSDGTAYDRSAGQRYTSNEVADMAEVPRDSYEPNIRYKSNGHAHVVTTGKAPRIGTKNPTKPQISKPKPPEGEKPKRTEYNYHDENGQVLYQSVRLDYSNGAKDFFQRQPDDQGSWVKNLQDVRRVPLRLPDVITAERVYIHEGEKAAEAHNADLQAAGSYGVEVATTSPQGAGSGHLCDWAPLHGKDVVLVPDNNEAGEKYRDAVIQALEGKAKSVRVVELPDRGTGGDYVDFRAAGHSFDDFQLLASQCGLYLKPKRFNFASLADVMKRPAPKFLIQRLLTIGGTSLLTAKHASFKSFIALDMGLCVATGRAWHGYGVQRGPVVYIAAEGAAGLSQRAAAWLSHHDEETPENFIVLDTPFQVANVADRAAFIEEISALNPVLIILDTLARCAVGLDENNAGDMGAFADALGDLARETGAHVLTVHHNNKGGEYRGSSAVPAAVDTHLSIERNREADTLNLKSEKQKDFEELPDLLFGKIEVPLPGTNGEKRSLVFEIQETFSGSRFQLSTVEQKVLGELVSTFGLEGATASKWCASCKELGISERHFYRSQKRLVDLKAVNAPAGQKRGGIFTPSPDYCHSLPFTAKGSETVTPKVTDFHCHPSLEGGSDGSNRQQGEIFKAEPHEFPTDWEPTHCGRCAKPLPESFWRHWDADKPTAWCWPCHHATDDPVYGEAESEDRI